MKDLIENLEEFGRVGTDISTAARQVSDLMVLYAELLGYVNYVSAKYPSVDIEAMLHVEENARREQEEVIDVA